MLVPDTTGKDSLSAARAKRETEVAPFSASRSVTIVDIAEAAGVSRAAVSLVLRGKPGVGPQTRERIQATMRELGYVYNRGAANLRQSRTSVVGMIVNDLTNPFVAELAVGIERGLSVAGYVPFMSNTAESVVRQAEVARTMREHGAAGIIICPAFGTTADELTELASGLPIVLAVRRVAGARCAAACSENEQGARRAAQHLLSLGHKRIAFLGSRSPAIVREERLAGYRAALAAQNIEFDPALVVESAPTRLGGLDAMNAVLCMAERPTAALCFNDVVAIGAMIAATRQGLVVGKDMAIVGFDDIAEASLVSPALTTVAVDGAALGEHAARLLLAQINGGNSGETYIGDARLVVRGSCGAKLLGVLA